MNKSLWQKYSLTISLSNSQITLSGVNTAYGCIVHRVLDCKYADIIIGLSHRICDLSSLVYKYLTGKSNPRLLWAGIVVCLHFFSSVLLTFLNNHNYEGKCILLILLVFR